MTKIWAKTDIKRSFFARRSKKGLGLGRSPPQELEEVYIKGGAPCLQEGFHLTWLGWEDYVVHFDNSYERGLKKCSKLFSL